MRAPLDVLLGVVLVGLGGCEDEEVAAQRCINPLIELVRWRDGVELDLRYRGVVIAPGELAARERAQVEATVAALTAERTRCRMTWNVLLMQPPDNPALRLREEAILTLTDTPLRAYPAEAVGAAGVSLNGMPARTDAVAPAAHDPGAGGGPPATPPPR